METPPTMHTETAGGGGLDVFAAGNRIMEAVSDATGGMKNGERLMVLASCCATFIYADTREQPQNVLQIIGMFNGLICNSVAAMEKASKGDEAEPEMVKPEEQAA